MAVGRAVATTGATALLAGPQVHPARADSYAVLTFTTLRMLDAGNGRDVRASLIGHNRAPLLTILVNGSNVIEGVEFRDVSYRTAGGTRVLDTFSLTVNPGEVLALVGASGAGKTTVLKLVNRLLVADTGEVLVQGKDTRQWDPIRLRRAIGYVIQEVGLFPHLTVGDNVAVVPRLEKWPEKKTRARVHELLQLVALPPDIYADRWPDELSGGQRQRVGVARALAVDPPVLLMDEPFGALDPVTRRQLQQEFRGIQSRVRKCVILVTHDMAEAMTLGDRIAVMDNGRVIWSGPPKEILTCDDERVRQLVEAVLPLSPSQAPTRST